MIQFASSGRDTRPTAGSTGALVQLSTATAGEVEREPSASSSNRSAEGPTPLSIYFHDDDNDDDDDKHRTRGPPRLSAVETQQEAKHLQGNSWKSLKLHT